MVEEKKFIGAEAVLERNGKTIRKKRVSKGYRIKEIDQPLRKIRTRTESRIIKKARRLGVKVPDIISTSEHEIVMEFVDGQILRDALDDLEDHKTVCRKIGESIAKMHDGDVVHGDLTTSNMILKEDEVYFIDFGLAESSKKIEDKAVDLHLLKEALEAKHTGKWKMFFNEILKHYKPNKREEIINRMQQIERRGRYTKKN